MTKIIAKIQIIKIRNEMGYHYRSCSHQKGNKGVLWTILQQSWILYLWRSGPVPQKPHPKTLDQIDNLSVYITTMKTEFII